MLFESPFTIWSGGQTGVDQGALDCALMLGIPHTGWCPKNRRSEAGEIPSKYLLKETSSWKYVPRTKRNIEGTDGTLILTWGPFSDQGSGTKFTRDYALKIGKPFLDVDLKVAFENQNATSEVSSIFIEITSIIDFLSTYAIINLNVAGPRESKCSGIQYKTGLFLCCVLKDFLANK